MKEYRSEGNSISILSIHKRDKRGRIFLSLIINDKNITERLIITTKNINDFIKISKMILVGKS